MEDSKPEKSHQGFRLLVVDDDPAALDFLRLALEEMGYEVAALANGGDAIQRVDGEKFNAAFVDASMPNIDGFRVIRYIRSSPSNSAIPIIMLTGFDDVQTMRAGFEAGITFFQPKPVDREKLAGLLRPLEAAMLREKRSYVRLPVKTEVLCKYAGEDFVCPSVNVSEGGMLMDGAPAVPPGKFVTLSFTLPGSSGTVNAHAVTLRAGPGSLMAVQFVGLAAGDLKAVQNYIAGGGQT